ncbi:MAG: CsgG/HfaB family protein, partial [Thermosynechococcaceae cyanobacterium]
LLTNQLVKEERFILIERSKIDAVIAEQNLGASGRIEPTTAAQIGRILGVDAVLIGSVTKFDVENKSKGFSLGSMFGSGNSKQIATVQLSSRLVSTTTGEILAVAEGTGQSEQKNENLSVGGFGSNESSDSRGRVLGEAAELAVKQVSAGLVASAAKLSALAPVVPVVDAVIADITGNQVVLNKGGQAGFRPGMILSIERVIKRIKDPVTGKTLRMLTQPIGRLQLTEVDAQSSVGKILAGKGGIQVGDRAKAIE